LSSKDQTVNTKSEWNW